MSEENTGLNAQEELLRRLKSIGVDLWGNGPSAADRAKAEEAVEADFASAGKPEAKGKKAPEQRASEKEERLTLVRPKRTIENLWMVADETVDWTEAMLYASPRDGLTSPKLWSFYHRMAPQVLAGKIEAYAEVLTTLNPLGDLTEYVSGMVLRTPGPDRVECEFECQQDDLEKYGKTYLGALSLRIARDLLAALPVEEVGILGKLEGEEKVRVTFRRDQLLKRNMSFLDPVEFVEECGGKY